MSILLQVKNITKIYPNQPKPGLDNISFEVAQGEFLGIMGASGSGKTTLLNVLSTIDVPTNGHIVMGKTHIEKLGQRQAADFRKNNLGFIFQEYFLLDSLTVRENIAVPLTLLHKPAQEIDRKVKELAELFGIDSQLKKYPSELSGGQRQRVAAARNGKTPSSDFCRRTYRCTRLQFRNRTAYCIERGQSYFGNHNPHGNARSLCCQLYRPYPLLQRWTYHLRVAAP